MDVLERAKRVKLLLLDVDGVLTNGKVSIGNYGDEIKTFDIPDGLGICLIKKAGLKCAIITAKSSKIVKIRAKQLRIDKVYENHYKIKSFNDIQKRFKVTPEEIAFLGDDIIDIPILKRVGLAVCVPDAAFEAKSVAHYITKKPGGSGAIRELSEMILKSQNKWESVTKRYFE